MVYQKTTTSYLENFGVPFKNLQKSGKKKEA
jgi:hypothetical protein